MMSDSAERVEWYTVRHVHGGSVYTLTVENKFSDTSTFYLIGLDHPRAPLVTDWKVEDSIITKEMEKMLVGRRVRLDRFDGRKVQPDRLYQVRTYAILDDSTLVNETLIRKGLAGAKVNTDNLDIAYLEKQYARFHEVEMVAYGERRGIWSRFR